jgi:hypothetical protein
MRFPVTGHFLQASLATAHWPFSTSRVRSVRDRPITVKETIKFYRLTSETEVSAPYIFALTSLKVPVDEEAVSQFASMIKEMKNQWNSAEKWDDKLVTAPIGPGTPALFIVNYPVTVRTKDEIFCLSVTSYSVLPVEAAANYCGSRQ